MPGTIVKRDFSFKYKGGTNFRWLEDFEGFGTTSGISIKKSNNSDTTFTILTTASQAFEGTKCFYFAVDDDKKLRSSNLFRNRMRFPKSGAPVFLEINYKCTQPFDIGVFSGTSSIMYPP